MYTNAVSLTVGGTVGTIVVIIIGAVIAAFVLRHMLSRTPISFIFKFIFNLSLQHTHLYRKQSFILIKQLFILESLKK